MDKWMLVVAGLLAGTGCASGTKGEATSAPIPVRVAPARTETVREWVRLFGRVVPPPDRDATLAPQVAGVLLDVAVRQGEVVRKGEVVARVDPAPLDDALRAAEAAEKRAAAEAEFRAKAAVRTRNLLDKGVASRQEAEADEAAATAAESGLAEARAALATAQRRRGWAELRAPFDGVVVKVVRRAGEPVDGSPATGVVELAAQWPVEIAADAVAESLQEIRPGAPAEVSVRDATTAARAARVTRVARSVDPASGAGEVRLAVSDAAAALVLGTPVDVRIVVRERKGALTVPESAVRHGPEGHAEVVVAAGGKASVRTVSTGITEGGRVEISSGLGAGDEVVVEDVVGIVDGMPVDAKR